MGPSPEGVSFSVLILLQPPWLLCQVVNMPSRHLLVVPCAGPSLSQFFAGLTPCMMQTLANILPGQSSGLRFHMTLVFTDGQQMTGMCSPSCTLPGGLHV